MSPPQPHHIRQHNLTIPGHSALLGRKRAFVSLGLCAMCTGRSWLAHQVYQAFMREDLTHG